MPDFIWRPTATVKVPEANSAWTPALDYLVPNRLYRIRIKDATAKWTLEGAKEATEPTMVTVETPAKLELDARTSDGSMSARGLDREGC